jgi:hypothetical protein
MYSQEVLDRAVFFPVENVAGEEGKRQIVNGLSGKIISEVSGRYALVSNREVIQPFIDHFGLDHLRAVTVFNAGRSYAFKFDTGRVFELEGDQIREQLVVQNSYDKTKSFSFMFGAFRFVCSNGLYTAAGSVITYKKIHVGDIPVREMVHDAITGYGKNDFAFWRGLQQKPLDLNQELELASRWQPFEVEKEHSVNAEINRHVKYNVESLLRKPESMDNQRNAWGLFNQMNQAINWSLARKDITKRILGDRRSEEFLRVSLN